jgi:hypothetical protein
MSNELYDAPFHSGAFGQPWWIWEPEVEGRNLSECDITSVQGPRDDIDSANLSREVDRNAVGGAKFVVEAVQCPRLPARRPFRSFQQRRLPNKETIFVAKDGARRRR